jgi:serine/threonine protein kinase
MAANPRVLGLLEEMLDTHKTPEEVCCDCPELVPEVQQRWQEFCRIDAELGALLPGLGTSREADATAPGPADAGLPQVPGYEVEAVLGRGGMGVVYKARHLALKRTVALKMLAAGHPYPAERARFRAEAEAVARLQHPNIVQIHEVGEAEGRPFIALEYVAGGSLDEGLAGQPLPPRDAARMVAALAGAMHLAHSHNLVHRDLKPGNVLLQKDEGGRMKDEQNQDSSSDSSFILHPSSFIPKVTDFGLVRLLDADSGQTFDGAVMGTPSYMAPEQAEGRARAAGPAADVWALGAILYECLTGRPPFAGATPLETLEQVRSREPAAPSSLNRQTPRDLETICLKCLSKQPERRYSSARELADDLGRFVRGEPVAARPVSRSERVAKWVRRNPTVACLSAVAALAVGAGAVASLLFGVEAGRKADALEQQTSQLQAQTRAAEENARRAEENARRAEENEKKVARAFLSGLLNPIGRNPHVLIDAVNAEEAEALRQLRAAPAPLRLQFLETALRDPETARRIGHRADWVVQAIVGCDRALRADVARLVVLRIQEPGASQEVKLACARLGLALNLADRAWAERSADALLVELRNPLVDRADYPPLAEAIAALSERLPPGADQVGRALDVFLTLLRDSLGQPLPVFEQHLRAVKALRPGLDAAAATRAAKALDAILCRPDCAPPRWPSLCKALAVVCGHLPSSDAAAHINRTVDYILEAHDATEEKDKSNFAFQARALGELCGRLDAARASRAAGAVIAILGDSEKVNDGKQEFIARGNIASVLTELAGRLDAPGGLRALEDLVLVLRHSSGNVSLAVTELKAALVALCRRLDAAGAARVAEAMVAAVRDSKTAARAHAIFADALPALADRLTPDRAASLESALVDSLVADLAEVKPQQLRGLMGQALAVACGRPGATNAARAAEALVGTIRDPQTPLMTFKSLAEALAAVLGQLAPKEAAAHANQTMDALNSLWVARTAPTDRAFLADALAAVCGRPGATNAARGAEALVAAIRDPKTPLEALKPLTAASAAVLGQLPPKEAPSYANQAIDALDSRWVARTTLKNLAVLGEALAAVWTRLDPTDAAARAKRVAADLEAELQDSRTAPNRFAGVATALSAVYYQLEPAERSGRAKAVADFLVAGLRKFRTDPMLVAQNWDALATLCGHLDRPADVLIPVMDDPTVQQVPSSVYETMFQKAAARLGERDLERLLEHPLAAGRLQRILLDALAKSKNRSFRNTWDYLDWTASH